MIVPKPKRLDYDKLLKKADAVFSIWIRNRDGNRCVICGSTYKVQNGHLFKRGKKRIRFDEYNCNAQCSICNFKHNKYPEPYTAFFLRKYGQEKYLELEKISEINGPYQIPRDFLEDIIEKYAL